MADMNVAGSLLSLRTLVESGPTARMVAVSGSWLLSFFMTPPSPSTGAHQSGCHSPAGRPG